MSTGKPKQENAHWNFMHSGATYIARCNYVTQSGETTQSMGLLTENAIRKNGLK